MKHIPLTAPLPPRSDAARWLAQMFASRAAAQGAVVRRSVADVERLVGREAFLAEIDRRGFGLVENAGQFVILCNREPVRIMRRTERRQIP